MDVLSDVLDTVRLQGTVFGAAELSPPWGISAGPRPRFAFHVIARGTCWLEVDGRAPARVGAGDVVVLAPDHGHALRDAPDSPIVPIEGWQEEMPRGPHRPGQERFLCPAHNRTGPQPQCGHHHPG